MSYERLVRRDGYEKWSVTFETIELGVDVDDALFEFDALDAPSGTRIIDRSDADAESGSPVVYYTPASDAEVEVSVDGMLEIARRFPQSPSREDGGGRRQLDTSIHRSFWLVLIVVNLILGVVFLTIVLRRAGR